MQQVVRTQESRSVNSTINTITLKHSSNKFMVHQKKLVLPIHSWIPIPPPQPSSPTRKELAGMEDTASLAGLGSAPLGQSFIFVPVQVSISTGHRGAQTAPHATALLASQVVSSKPIHTGGRPVQTQDT